MTFLSVVAVPVYIACRSCFRGPYHQKGKGLGFKVVTCPVCRGKKRLEKNQKRP